MLQYSGKKTKRTLSSEFGSRHLIGCQSIDVVDVIDTHRLLPEGYTYRQLALRRDRRSTRVQFEGDRGGLVQANAHIAPSERLLLTMTSSLPARRRLVTLLFVACGRFLTIIDASFYRPVRANTMRMKASTLPRKDTPPLFLLHYDTRSSSNGPLSTSALQSTSLKFKNFDMMLDAFRGEPVLIYFMSMVCGPCKLQSKELANVKKLMGESALPVLAIDTERFPHVGARYGIGKLPCLLFVKDREILLRLEGLTKAEDLVQHFHLKVDKRP